MLQKVRRDDIKRPVENLLWGLAAGRCQFDGCNRELWKSSVTQETVNIAEKAHIYAFSDGGPRGNDGVSRELLNELSNLLLVCHDCHRTIDKTVKGGGRYPVELLRRWKREHEERIQIVGGIAPAKKSHVLLYGANIGEHNSPLTFNDAASAMFPRRYPARDSAIELGLRNSAAQDHDPGYWRREAENLLRLFDQKVRQPLADGQIDHLSVFALAPQPLLILLGSLLIDIAPADVFQRRREPPTWRWSEDTQRVEFRVEEPAEISGPPALVLALSATINSERVHAVDPTLSIWRVTIDGPHNDFLQSAPQLRAFRETVRRLLDRIKARHGEGATVSMFPAMPVACAVELGRVRMPKADLPWVIYDQLPGRGFVSALEVPLAANAPRDIGHASRLLDSMSR